MKDLIYQSLVERLSDSAFKLCVHILFPRLGYVILSEGDVRRIDLKEKLYTLLSPYFSKGKSSASAFDRYVSTIEGEFRDHLQCADGSGAAKYHVRAMDILNLAEGKDYDLADLESLFVIYLALFRSRITSGEKKAPIVSADLTVKPEDHVILKQIVNYRAVQIRPQQLKTAVISATSKATLPREAAYIINVLLYCHLLQLQGDLTEEEE